jgi:hypothetical protein
MRDQDTVMTMEIYSDETDDSFVAEVDLYDVVDIAQLVDDIGVMFAPEDKEYVPLSLMCGEMLYGENDMRLEEI